MKKFLLILLMFLTSNVAADTIKYEFMAVQDDGEVLTGMFDYVYVPGDFENGTGVLTEAIIPGYILGFDALAWTIDIVSIEITLAANLDSQNVGITMKLLDPLTPESGSAIDLNTSFYEDITGAKHLYQSGAVATIPVPSALWLFGAGLIGLVSVARMK